MRVFGVLRPSVCCRRAAVLVACIALAAMASCKKQTADSGKSGSSEPGAGPGGGSPANASSSIATSGADLAEERARFRTVLLRQGPSPGSYQIVRLPAGVQEVYYRSGPRQLGGWCSAPPADGQK